MFSGTACKLEMKKSCTFFQKGCHLILLVIIIIYFLKKTLNYKVSMLFTSDTKKYIKYNITVVTQQPVGLSDTV